METVLMESTEGKLGCDVDGPLIMAAAAAFVLWKLNLAAEGSLPLSQAAPALRSLLQIHAAQTEVLHHKSDSEQRLW